MPHSSVFNFTKNNLTWLLPIAALPYLIIRAYHGGDFSVYMGAAELLADHKNCYNVWITYKGVPQGVQYGYSPLFAMLLIPFHNLPWGVPQFLLSVANIFMLLRIFSLFIRWLNFDVSSKKYLWLWLVLLFSLRFILNNFELGQINILILYLSVEGLNAIFFRQKIVAGTALLALGINFKILPIVFLPYLLWRKQHMAFFAVLFFLILFFLIPSVYIGFDFNSLLHKEWWSILNPMNAKYNALQNDENYRMQGIAALFAAYFYKSNVGNFQVLLSNWSELQIILAVNIARSVLVSFTIYFLSWKPFRNITSSRLFLIEISYILLITPLIFPQQNKHAFINILPAVCCIMFFILMPRTKQLILVSIALLVAAWLLSTFTTDGIIGKQLCYYGECLKFVTIGTLFFIPLLTLTKSQTEID